jgi:hypothetical protein
MPTPITVAAFTIGVPLLCAALLGKEIKIVAIEIPALRGLQRASAGALGAALIYIGLMDPFGKPITPPAQTPDLPAPTSAGQTPVPAPIAEASPVPSLPPKPSPTPESVDITALASATATSELAPETVFPVGTVFYDAPKAIDARQDTAWVEGEPGPGIGQDITLQFPHDMIVSALGIDGGYDRDADIFYKNNRVRTAWVIFSSGEKQRIELADTRGLQQFPLQTTRTQAVKIVIDSVYPGSIYDDTPIAEVEIWGYSAP